MNATEAKRKLCEIRSNLTDDKQQEAIWNKEFKTKFKQFLNETKQRFQKEFDEI